MYNFKRGIDWVADPTGATVLPNHCFVDGIEGNDSNTGATPAQALKTLTQAKALFASSYTIVVAPDRYVDQLGHPTNGETYKIIGDSADGDVNFIDSTGTLRGLAVSFSENCTLIGYLNTSVGNSRKLINCTFVDCIESRQQQFSLCKFINTPIDLEVPGHSYNCTFINSPTITNMASNLFITIRSCYFDSLSTLSNTTSNDLKLIDNHFEDKTTWDISSVTYNSNNTDGASGVYDLNLLNYSFNPLTSPLLGRGYADGLVSPTHLAGFYIGERFYVGTTNFDAKIAANPNLIVSNNEIINIGTNDVEILESDDIILDSVQVFGTPHKVGIINYLSTVVGLNASLNNLERVLEIAYSDSDFLPIGPFKKFRFGDPASINANGKTNGETGYNWDDNTVLFVRKFRVRFGIVKPGLA